MSSCRGTKALDAKQALGVHLPNSDLCLARQRESKHWRVPHKTREPLSGLHAGRCAAYTLQSASNQAVLIPASSPVSKHALSLWSAAIPKERSQGGKKLPAGLSCGAWHSKRGAPLFVTRRTSASSMRYAQRLDARPCLSDSWRRFAASALNRPWTEEKQRRTRSTVLCEGRIQDLPIH